jgi:hypothetical protein
MSNILNTLKMLDITRTGLHIMFFSSLIFYLVERHRRFRKGITEEINKGCENDQLLMKGMLNAITQRLDLIEGRLPKTEEEEKREIEKYGNLLIPKD